jgi:anaerobic magnesium-protoporphyrin IX monomethyl ester cyclase
MRVVLIQPQVESRYAGMSRSGMYPPLGLLSIAAALEQAFGGAVSVRVIDEEVSEHHTLVADHDTVVGISTNSFNYRSVLERAKRAKDAGGTVVLGGSHASALAHEIMTKRPFVDYVVRDEGEAPMVELVRQLQRPAGVSPEAVPNLVYRMGSDVRVSPVAYENDLAQLPRPARHYVDPARYFERFVRRYPDLPFKRPTSIYSQKGCEWREKSGGCLFCGRQDTGPRFRNIQEVWNEIRSLRDDWGVDHIWDIGDDLNCEQWVRTYIEARPVDIDISFMFYTRADRITSVSVELLKALGTFEVFIGFESGDEDMLRAIHKGSSLQQNRRAVDLLTGTGIHVFPSFVLGLPGETEQSMRKTLEFARNVADSVPVYRLAASVMAPIPGSPAFDMLLRDPGLRQKYHGQDDFDLSELSRIWVERFCAVDMATIEHYQQEICALAPYSGAFLRRADCAGSSVCATN